MSKTPDEIFKSASPLVQRAIQEILKQQKVQKSHLSKMTLVNLVAKIVSSSQESIDENT